MPSKLQEETHKTSHQSVCSIRQEKKKHTGSKRGRKESFLTLTFGPWGLQSTWSAGHWIEKKKRSYPVTWAKTALWVIWEELLDSWHFSFPFFSQCTLTITVHKTFETCPHSSCEMGDRLHRAQCCITWSVVRTFSLRRVWHHMIKDKNEGKWKWSKVKTQKRRTVKWLHKSLNSTVTWPDRSTFSINFAQNTSGWFSLKWLNWLRRTRYNRNVSGTEKYVKSLCEFLSAGSSKRKLHLLQTAERWTKRVRGGGKSSNESHLVHILVLLLQSLLSAARWKRPLANDSSESFLSLNTAGSCDHWEGPARCFRRHTRSS